MHITNWYDLATASYYPQWGGISCYPRDPRRYIEILDSVQAMTSPSVMHLLNCAVRCMDPGEIYLEVGAWRGGTFIGALIDNDAHGIAIDDDSMTGVGEHNTDGRRNSEVWRENVERFGLAGRATFIDGSIPAAWEDRNLTDDRPVGVYLFDGDKSTPETVYDGLEGVIPFLASQALILVDDANVGQVRHAVQVFMREYHSQACWVLDISTPVNGWTAGFWDGMIGIAWGVVPGLDK